MWDGLLIEKGLVGLVGLIAFPQHATVYFVNHLIICHLQSVWVSNVSFVLR